MGNNFAVIQKTLLMSAMIMPFAFWQITLPIAPILGAGESGDVIPIAIDNFFGYPELRAICSCESNLSHYEDDGVTVLRGRLNRRDIGICQINEYYHSDRIEKLGIDIYTEKGNITFAKDLYVRQGTVPWEPSRSCWTKKVSSR